MGSLSSQAPKTTPKMGVMNENTPRREARYCVSSQNQTRKLTKQTSTDWKARPAQARGVGSKRVWPSRKAAGSSSAKPVASW